MIGKPSFLKKTLSSFLLITFLILEISSADPSIYPEKHPLAAELISQQQMMDPAAQKFKELKLYDFDLLDSLLTISKLLLGDPEEGSNPLKPESENVRSVVEQELRKPLNEIGISHVAFKNEVVWICYKKDILLVALKNSFSAKGLIGNEWPGVSDKYTIKVLPNKVDEVRFESGEMESIKRSIIILARRAQRAGRRLIIGYETGWIPGYDERHTLTHNALNPLIREIDNLGQTLRGIRLDNVVVVHKPAEELSAALLRAAGQGSRNFWHVIVLGDEQILRNKAFRALRPGKDPANWATFGYIDAEKLEQFYKKNSAFMVSPLLIEIKKMLEITLELAVGNEAPNHPIVNIYKKERKRVEFLPGARETESIKRPKLFKKKQRPLKSV